MAVRIAELLVENSDYQCNQDEIRYGLEVFLGAAVQLLIIISIAVLLGITKEVLAITVASMLLRKYSGGAHCHAYYRCTLCSIFIFMTLGFLVPLVSKVSFFLLLPLLALFTLITVLNNAPVDNPANPINDTDYRRRLKFKSLMIQIILLSIALIVNNIGYPQIAVSILLGITWQAFTLTAPGYLFINMWDRIFSYFETTFERKEVYNDEQI